MEVRQLLILHLRSVPWEGLEGHLKRPHGLEVPEIHLQPGQIPLQGALVPSGSLSAVIQREAEAAELVQREVGPSLGEAQAHFLVGSLEAG